MDKFNFLKGIKFTKGKEGKGSGGRGGNATIVGSGIAIGGEGGRGSEPVEDFDPMYDTVFGKRVDEPVEDEIEVATRVYNRWSTEKYVDHFGIYEPFPLWLSNRRKDA